MPPSTFQMQRLDYEDTTRSKRSREGRTMRCGHSAAQIKHAPLIVAGALVLVGLSAVLALTTWGAWVVNYDGGSYLVLAERIRMGLGYTFPDGSQAVFRGPGYSLAFSTTWLVAPISDSTAIWTSKSFVLIGSIATVGVVWLSVRKFIAAVVSGVAVATHPLIFASGAFYFVPDGMTAVFILIGTAVAAPGVGSTYGRWRPWVAGFVLGLGTLTKETAIFGLLVVAVIALNRWSWRGAAANLSVVVAGWAIPVTLWSGWVLSNSGHLPAPAAAMTGYAGWLSLILGIAAVLAALRTYGFDQDDVFTVSNDITVQRVLISASVVFVVPLIALLAIGSPAVQPIRESWESAVGAQLGTTLGADLSTWLLRSVAAVVVATVTIVHRRRSQMLPPVALISLGLALAGWGAISGFGVRNGAILVYGIGWMLGVLVADWSSRASGRITWRLVAATFVTAILGLNILGLSATNEWVAQRALNWDNPGVHRASDWLSTNARGKTVAGTPVFLSYMTFGTSGAFDTKLLPIFETNRTGAPIPPSSFNRRVWWAAHISRSPTGRAEIGRTYSRKFVSSIVEGDLLHDLATNSADLVVVTGTTRSTGPYEGAMLVPYMEAASWVRRVYTSTNSDLPYWVFIYEIVRVPRPAQSWTSTVYAPIPWRPSHLVGSEPALGLTGYESMIESVVETDP